MLSRRPLQMPAAGEVAVRVRASALNHRDLSIVSSRYGAAKPVSRVAVGDGSGEIAALGVGVTPWRVGERVTAPHFVDWIDGAYSPAIFARDLGNTADGWLAEKIVLPAAALVRVPDELQHEEAAALGAAGITAWAVMQSFAQIKPGDIVLTLGTGGVSVLALQIARLAGATVAITSSSDAKLALMRELGAEITVNYRTRPDWPAAIREATGGRGVDIVVETVGMTSLPQSLACCAPNARIGLLGALGGRQQGASDLSAMIGANAIVKGITSGSRRMLEDLLRACAARRLKPKIDRVFAFEQAADAYRYLDSGAHVGKVVIRHG
ncbi:MAG TPA: NAD(P)-dependent alcohol dehydrogenase [Steroidobacteraceae bacterium]|nr:NAD(P)-dependent alcohol dehydrogenase [Steroidobacteraceae bacterium]